ncbi:hypothetical protein [Pacificibacter marinus]|jgi:predicted DNA-binding transcriptional regulator AlpA|uniref:Prophage CP4-57 regulatory protein (AlpA) n=1 Tax=Pacificibacter marinus TaxID=658057 RepID=A0A1Y5RM88_9RHOB|nr:hypothetical protein [Pacificibacter marinus]SEK17468.1 hypothetical protein SAMN04488032_1013 [Pacificibacter marinus]SLN20756.1 hypothetical protein PAM7971_00647 [Pacificibacter marinus]
MGQALPIAVAEKNAARLLDMPTSVFLDLVNKGALPRPIGIASGVQRWSVAQLNAIMTGAAMEDDEFET